MLISTFTGITRIPVKTRYFAHINHLCILSSYTLLATTQWKNRGQTTVLGEISNRANETGGQTRVSQWRCGVDRSRLKVILVCPLSLSDDDGVDSLKLQYIRRTIHDAGGASSCSRESAHATMASCSATGLRSQLRTVRPILGLFRNVSRWRLMKCQ